MCTASLRTLLFAAVFLLGPAMRLPAQTTIHVPADQPTIQRAIDASTNGGTVLVSPGTYTENLDFHGHNITLTSSAGASTTILDGAQRGPTVSFHSGETSTAVLSGFTIRNGSSGLSSSVGGGGVYIGYASPIIQGNTFTDNYCNAISVQGSPTIMGNTITRTHTLSGAGTACEYPGTPILLYFSYHSPFVRVSGNTITANTEWRNGVILLWISDYAAVTNNFIHDNPPNGGGNCGVVCMENTTTATISGNDIENNTGADGGLSALIISAGAPYGPFQLRVVNNTFINNGTSAQINAENVSGRAIIANNLVRSASLGIACRTSPFNQVPPVTLSNDVFTGGSAYAAACNATAARQNLNIDPQLTPDAAGHSIPQATAVMDAGNDSILPQPDTDLAGNARAQSANAPVHIGIGAVEHAGAVTQPQARLVIAPSQYQVEPGQNISVTAALVNTGAAATAPANLKLYLDGAVIQTAGIVPGTTVTLSGIPVASGVHELYATTDATATLADTRTPALALNGASDLYSGSGQSVVMDISPPINVGSGISSQVQCHLSAADTGMGTVRIYDNGNILGATSVTGTAVANQTFFVTPGPHIYQCDYEGKFTSSVVGTQIVSDRLNTGGFYSLPDPSEYGDAVTIGASNGPGYDPSQNGRVLITEGATGILDAALDRAGDAYMVTTSLTPGVHTFRGTITTSTGISSASFTQTVHFAPTQITLSANPVTGTANVTPITLTLVTTSSYTGTPITGTVTLLNNGNPLNVAGVTNGTAVLPPGTLPQGTSLLIALYHGTTIFGSSLSNAVTVVMGPPPPPPDFNITPATPALAVKAQHHGNASFTLNALYGFNGTVTLSCGNLPPLATCTFKAAPYALSSTAPVTFTVETSAVPFYKSQVEPGVRTPLAFALPLPLLLLLRRRSSGAGNCALLLLATAVALAMTACSGKLPGYTPPGTYAVSINAAGTSGSTPGNPGTTTVTHTFPFTLTVMPE